MLLTDITIFFLGLSMVFYVLLGGADYGAGTLSLISRDQHKDVIKGAIGPVWEANHVWLVLAIVILFMGFPKIYALMSLYLHIPLLILLIGIVLRGTAFTFMHYDAIEDHTTTIYNWIFKLSSVITPLFLGIIIGALMLGKIDPNPTTFYAGFIAPWWNFFSILVGLFCVALFTFLAAVYLIGETQYAEQCALFIRSAKRINVAVVVIGALIFLFAHREGLPLLTLFYQSWVATSSVILATVLLIPLWYSLTHQNVILSRVLAVLQVICILVAWFGVQYPVAIETVDGNHAYTFYRAVASQETLLQLVIALIVGSIIILPFLYYLFKTFKREQFIQR